jgi:hypothetical protein
MVTEGLPVPCGLCSDDDDDDDLDLDLGLGTRRSSSSSPSVASDVRPSLRRSGSGRNPVSSDKENANQLVLQIPGIKNPSATAGTAPGSPRVVALQNGLNVNNQRDSSFRKTYDENDKKRAIPCENCALTLPKKTNEGSDSSGPMFTNSGPILRTRKPYERVFTGPVEEASPPKSDSSESDDSETAVTSNPRPSSSSNSSFSSRISHTHYIDYTSTHEPLAPSSFSIVRQSCLRTLSCETLPPSSNQFTSSLSSPFINSPFSSGPTGSTSSGGPIFFGDPLAGYTTAYILRIPDPTARGRRRVYALMALSTHRERLAMQTFSFLSAAFRELAAWIQDLAEAELERHESSPRAADERSPPGNHSTPTSSFLSGRSRRPDGKAGMSLRARGLAELVGLPDFFIELHARFVRLLAELGLLLGL